MARWLRNGINTSCGCKLRKGNSGPADYDKQTTEYHSWRAMKARCRNPKDPAYARYGGRGINICDEWFNSFDAFFRDVGTKPTPAHSIDRHPNKNGNYEKGNVRWATPIQQNRNMRTTRMLTHDGVTMSLSEWAEKLGWPRGLLYQRIRKGMPIDKALSQSRRHMPGRAPLSSKVNIPETW